VQVGEQGVGVDHDIRSADGLKVSFSRELRPASRTPRQLAMLISMVLRW
jgi:hypothetical protein